MLFSMAACPNCRAAAAQLERAGIAYEKILADQRLDLSNQYDIQRVPTLILNGANGTVQYVGLDAIRAFIQTQT